MENLCIKTEMRERDVKSTKKRNLTYKYQSKERHKRKSGGKEQKAIYSVQIHRIETTSKQKRLRYGAKSKNEIYKNKEDMNQRQNAKK